MTYFMRKQILILLALGVSMNAFAMQTEELSTEVKKHLRFSQLPDELRFENLKFLLSKSQTPQEAFNMIKTTMATQQISIDEKRAREILKILWERFKPVYGSSNYQRRDYTDKMGIDLLKQITAFYKTLSNIENEIEFIEAVRNQEIPKIKKYIQQGININAQLNDGDTALLVTSRLRNFEIIKLLIEKGADIYKNEYYGENSPLYYILTSDAGNLRHAIQNLKDFLATQKNFNVDYRFVKEVIKILSKRYLYEYLGFTEPESVMLERLLKADISKIENWLIRLKKEIAFINDARNGNIASVREAIIKGIDINAQTVWGFSALSSASYAGNKEIVAFLLSEGAYPNIQDNWGNTPLNDTLSKNNLITEEVDRIAIVKMLLETGANPNIIDKISGGTARANSSELIQLLVQAGTDLNYQNDFGYTPLISNAINRDYEGVKALLEAGADRTFKNYDGKNALERVFEERKKYSNPEIFDDVIDLLQNYWPKGKK